MIQTLSVNERTIDDAKLKQTKNLFNSIIKDENSTFYSTDKTNRNITDKARGSIYRKTEYLLSSMMNWKTKVTYV